MDAALPYPGLPAPRLNPHAERARQQAGAVPGLPAESRVPPEKQAQMRKAANEFEAMFIGQMMTPIFDSIEVDETFGGGHGESMFRSMLTTEYSKQVQQRGGFGLADQVYRELLRAQETAGGMNHG